MKFTSAAEKLDLPVMPGAEPKNVGTTVTVTTRVRSEVGAHATTTTEFVGKLVGYSRSKHEARIYLEGQPTVHVANRTHSVEIIPR